MRILLYSYVFWPSLGGIETVSDVLAESLVKLGHECIVVTETRLDGNHELSRSYEIVRRPSWRMRLALSRNSSVVHANGATLSMFPFARLANKPFLWTHNGYQVSCVDGLGWAYGRPAPMTPLASLDFHRRHRGWRYCAREAVKLGVRRFVASKADLNLAGSEWVARRQPLPNQLVAYNPYPLRRFRAVQDTGEYSYDFAYVGRLVGEKGLPTLIRAFHRLLSDPAFGDKKLAVIGSGDLRSELEALTESLNLTANVDFLGPRHGDALVEVMGRARVGIVPSVWEEPYGGVTLEWLSAGRSVIVSEAGGHAECAGGAALRFPNGDHEALFACMLMVLSDPELVQRQRQIASSRIEDFDEMKLTENFVRMYELAISRRHRSV